MALNTLQNSFNNTSDEIIMMILRLLLEHREPILSVGYSNYSFPDTYNIL